MHTCDRNENGNKTPRLVSVLTFLTQKSVLQLLLEKKSQEDMFAQ